MHSKRYEMPSSSALNDDDHHQQRRLSMTFFNLRKFHPISEPLVEDLFRPIMGFEWDLQPVPLPVITPEKSLPSSFQQFHQPPASVISHSSNNGSDAESLENASVCSDIFDDDGHHVAFDAMHPFPCSSGNNVVNTNTMVNDGVSGKSSFDNTDDEDFEDQYSQDDENRFKPFHEEKWSVRYMELVQFHREHGHAAVPHTYPPNQQLARWVKRQRRQYKLLHENKPTTLTADRLEILNALDFVWDSHEVNWQEKYIALSKYNKSYGDCNVPSNYSDKKLATWVKCQRRQYKLHMIGQPSSITQKRIELLERINFQWEIRTVKASRTKKTPVPDRVAPTDFDASIPKSKLMMKRRRSSLSLFGTFSPVPTWAPSA